MAELTALKVKIESGTGGSAKYPNFNTLAIVTASGMDWANYIDKEGLGWQYDKTSGHKESSTDSPLGQQWGVLVVPEAFTLQAVAAFPTLCTQLTETELTTFYDEKVAVNQTSETIDTSALQGLQAKLSLMESTSASAVSIVAMKAKISNAIDPDHDEPGIKTNSNKTWVNRKASAAVTIKAPA